MAETGDKEVNTVHEEWNWKQQVKKEMDASKLWKSNYGFLECEKPSGTISINTSDEVLKKKITECGATYEYMKKKLYVLMCFEFLPCLCG